MSRHAPAQVLARDRRSIRPDLSRQEWQALAAVLLLGFVVRLVALRAPPLPVDLNNWSAWAQRLPALGPGGFYPGNSLADFGPAYALLLGLIGVLARPGSAAAPVLFRLPAILCDLGIGAAIFVTVLRLGEREGLRTSRWPITASIAAAVWLLNPVVILLSAAWGQIESVYSLFLLLSVLLLDASPAASLVCLVLALLIEPRSLELAPLVVIALIARHGLRPLLRPALAAVVLWCVASVPFFGWNVLGGPFGVLYASSNAYPYTALNALNIWAVGGSFGSDLTPILLGVTPFAAGLLLYGVGIWYGVVVLQDQLQRLTNLRLLGPLMGTYLLFLPYAVLTRQHDRWLLPVLPFLLTLAVVCLQRPLQTRRFAVAPAVLYALLSLVLLLDLYRVYEAGLYTPNVVPASIGVYATIAAAQAVWAALGAWAFWAFAVLLLWLLPSGLFLRGAAAPVEEGANDAPAVA